MGHSFWSLESRRANAFTSERGFIFADHGLIWLSAESRAHAPFICVVPLSTMWHGLIPALLLFSYSEPDLKRFSFSHVIKVTTEKDALLFFFFTSQILSRKNQTVGWAHK